MSRKVWIGLGVAWAVITGIPVIACFVIATVGHTTLNTDYSSQPRMTEEYRWTGGSILLTRANGKNSVCTVTPDQGAARDVPTYNSDMKYAVKPVSPWFSGAAGVRCTEMTKVRTGTPLTLYSLSKNRLVEFGAVAVVVAPVAAAYVLTRERKPVAA